LEIVSQNVQNSYYLNPSGNDQRTKGRAADVQDERLPVMENCEKGQITITQAIQSLSRSIQSEKTIGRRVEEQMIHENLFSLKA